MKNSRYEIRKYQVAFTDNREEAIEIARGEKWTIWIDQYEVIDWGIEDEIFGIHNHNTEPVRRNAGNDKDQ